jgi:saccharopine dehydrogenase (NAD+, L-lysine-forming)
MASLPEVFTDIKLASRTKSKCDVIAEKAGNNRISTAQVDADDVPQLVGLIKSFKPDIVVNVALPYQDLHIMDACLETKTSYLDTANYEPLEEAKFEYSWHLYLQHTRQNTISMKFITSTLWIAMQEIMANHLQRTLIQK